MTLQASWQDQDAWAYEVTFHRAHISDPLAPPASNVVTTAPVTVNIGEARVSFPLRGMQIELAGRVQDDQPRPYHGFQASIEAAITYAL